MQYILKSRHVMIPILFFFMGVNLAIHGHLWFLMNFRVVFSVFCTNATYDFDKDCFEPIDCFG